MQVLYRSTRCGVSQWNQVFRASGLTSSSLSGIDAKGCLHAWHCRVPEPNRLRIAGMWTWPQCGQVQVGTGGRCLLRVRGIKAPPQLRRIDAEHGVTLGHGTEIRERRIMSHREVFAATRRDLAVRLQDRGSFARWDFGELHGK